jgi:virulence-associated protein VapD
MYAIAFDLTVKLLDQHHPKGYSAAYSDIQKALGSFGFKREQGSLYLTNNEDMANLFGAIQALKSMAWFPKCVTDIRAFKVEQWSDFTAFCQKP